MLFTCILHTDDMPEKNTQESKYMSIKEQDVDLDQHMNKSDYFKYRYRNKEI